MNELTHLDLFSGIGGFSIGFENAGFRTIGFCELDPEASTVLAHDWPSVPNFGDVQRLCRRGYDCGPIGEAGEMLCPRCAVEFGECDCVGTDQFTDEHGFPVVVTGGVPCQPASALGQMRGALDERWLWPEAVRIVSELRPRYAVFENPPSVLVLPDFHGVLGAFTALGYDCWWDVIPAGALGAGHLRERVIFILTNANSPRLEGYAGNGSGIWRPEARRSVATPDLRSRRCDSPKWYETQSPVCPLVNGLSARLVEAALRCVGNSIVPEVAQIIGQAINQIESEII